MVRLTEIKLNGNTISSTIYPEAATEPGYIKVDLQTEDIIESSLPVGYEYCTSHINYARRALIKMAHSGEIPQKKTIMWY